MRLLLKKIISKEISAWEGNITQAWNRTANNRNINPGLFCRKGGPDMAHSKDRGQDGKRKRKKKEKTRPEVQGGILHTRVNLGEQNKT